MKRRERWRAVLAAELELWSAKPAAELAAALASAQRYDVERDSIAYQVEVRLLEDTDRYIHVMVSVDDGGLPGSLLPATGDFVREKP